MDFIYGVSHFERSRGSFPALPLINLTAEQVPTEQAPSLQSRPGLVTAGVTLGSGPIHALFHGDGVLSGERYSITGTRAYKDTTNLGAVNGTGHAKVLGFETFAFFNRGQSLYSYNGTTFSTIAFPDSANVTTICVGSSRLIAIRADSGKIYWSSPLGGTIDALSFATAEYSPDHLLDCVYVGDRLVLLGSSTVEFWQPTGDQDAPFEPIIGLVYPKGVKNTGAATSFNTAIAWVTNDNQICIDSPDNVISEPGLNAKIEAEASVKLWSFVLDGIDYLCLRTSTASYVFNSVTSLWSEFTSYGLSNWICQCYDSGEFGSATNGSLYEWGTTHVDLSGNLERRFRAWIPITDSTVPLNAVTLRLAPGQTPYDVGEYAEPSVELRLSQDSGNTWTEWLPRSLGSSGEYRKLTRWNSLGSFGYPGVLAEFRVTSPVPLRVSGLYANQTGGAI